MPLTQDIAHIGFLHDEAFFEWQRRLCVRVGVPESLALGIPDIPFGPYAAAREERKRRAAK